MGDLETPDEFVTWLRYLADLRRRNHHIRPHASALTRAADLLERLALRPIPVSERLPEPEDCDELGRCWWFDMRVWKLSGPMEDSEESMHILAACFSHWLPAHALPLPEGE